ncbi:hypothetical protein GCM10022198_19670 [Klugiella xanthotipulae]|uniref:Excreted virulence factor EspC (Type VII ESX diderm) n=1 Tax=Klugiella xanthotipulae TaxID=244735 RepID=A0A543I6U6_9MICO|nr:hypothetical protein [Klugiella xanthotipulae]TQM66297.1 hypothetical protein FB466_1134 [Klugiella xanthotipulae]
MTTYEVNLDLLDHHSEAMSRLASDLDPITSAMSASQLQWSHLGLYGLQFLDGSNHTRAMVQTVVTAMATLIDTVSQADQVMRTGYQDIDDQQKTKFSRHREELG